MARSAREHVAGAEITLAEHPAYKVPILGFRGTPTGSTPLSVVQSGVLPTVNTGIAASPASVRSVQGLSSPPMSVFVSANGALAQRAEWGHVDSDAGGWERFDHERIFKYRAPTSAHRAVRPARRSRRGASVLAGGAEAFSSTSATGSSCPRW